MKGDAPSMGGGGGWAGGGWCCPRPVALVGHATGEWEEGGEGVQAAQGGGQGERKFRNLQVGRGGEVLHILSV